MNSKNKIYVICTGLVLLDALLIAIPSSVVINCFLHRKISVEIIDSIIPPQPPTDIMSQSLLALFKFYIEQPQVWLLGMLIIVIRKHYESYLKSSFPNLRRLISFKYSKIQSKYQLRTIPHFLLNLLVYCISMLACIDFIMLLINDLLLLSSNIGFWEATIGLSLVLTIFYTIILFINNNFATLLGYAFFRLKKKYKGYPTS